MQPFKFPTCNSSNSLHENRHISAIFILSYYNTIPSKKKITFSSNNYHTFTFSSNNYYTITFACKHFFKHFTCKLIQKTICIQVSIYKLQQYYYTSILSPTTNNILIGAFYQTVCMQLIIEPFKHFIKHFACKLIQRMIQCIYPKLQQYKLWKLNHMISGIFPHYGSSFNF